MENYKVNFVQVPKNFEKVGIDVAEIYVLSGLCKSKSEVRRYITSGAMKINDIQIKNPYSRVCISEKEKIIYIVEYTE